MQNKFTNITLIGMAGAGKTTIGSLLAELSGKEFIDTDELIIERTGMALQDYINQLGHKRFQQVEEQTLLSINLQNHVIATGGSAIYSERGMKHLQASGPLILLEVGVETLEQRVRNLNTRGLINPEAGGSFRDLFYARKPLYKRWADIRIECSARSPKEIAREILKNPALHLNH